LKRLLYYNPSFDADLAGDARPRIARVAREIGVYSLLSADDDESVILDAIPDEGYVKRLSKYGFHTDSARHGIRYDTGRVWGWSMSSVRRLEDYGCACEHPSFDIVAHVNSRAFSADIARTMGLKTAGKVVSSIEELTQEIVSMSGPSLVKPLFGSSGIGHTVIRGSADGKGLADAGKLNKEHGISVTVEPFLERIDDYAANFYLERNGTVSSLTFHEGIVDGRGVFRGILLKPDPVLPEEFHNEFSHSVNVVGTALRHAGYFGDVGIDAFTYNDFGTVRMNPLCEINARVTMGEVARGCRRRLGGAFCCMRQYPFGIFPVDPDEFDDCIRPFGYDPRRGNGIFLASPATLMYEGVIMKPYITLIYSAAETEGELKKMTDHIRMRAAQKGHGTCDG
jgi:hypothetical protein